MIYRKRIVGILLNLAILLIIFIFFQSVWAAESKETIYSARLMLEKNESGTYNWTLKNPGSIISLKATGSVSSNGSAKVYIEKDGKKYLLFDSTKPLFDIDIKVLPEYKKISPGDEILVQITLLNLRGFGSRNVTVKYLVKDSKENLIASEEEIVHIETQAKFVRKLIIPSEIKSGVYAAFVEVSANGVILGTGSDTFEVKGKNESVYPTELKYYILGLVGVVSFIIILFIAKYIYGSWRKKKGIAEMKEKLPLEMTKKLEDELNALELGYKSGLISEESYQKQKKRIEEKLNSLKK